MYSVVSTACGFCFSFSHEMSRSRKTFKSGCYPRLNCLRISTLILRLLRLSEACLVVRLVSLPSAFSARAKEAKEEDGSAVNDKG